MPRKQLTLTDKYTPLNYRMIVYTIIAVSAITSLILYLIKKSKPSPAVATSNTATLVSAKKHLPTPEEAIILVKELAKLGYYQYAADTDIAALKSDLTSSLTSGIISTIYHERTFLPLDLRLYMLDGETLFEQGGFTDYLREMKPLFEKMDFDLDISHHREEGDAYIDHHITLNGKTYIIFDHFDGYGWGEAAQRFAEILNDQLALQHKAERIYLINGANDGAAIFLTNAQFKLLDQVLKDDRWKPLPVERWCQVFQVNPGNYIRNGKQ